MMMVVVVAFITVIVIIIVLSPYQYTAHLGKTAIYYLHSLLIGDLPASRSSYAYTLIRSKGNDCFTLYGHMATN